MKTIVLRGADIKVYINGNPYKEVQQIEYTINKQVEAIYGIDSVAAQELAIQKLSVTGSITGIRIRYSGGLQGKGVMSLIGDSMSTPYITIEIKDRATDEMILTIPKAMADQERLAVAAKGVARLSFRFQGILPLSTLDRKNP